MRLSFKAKKGNEDFSPLKEFETLIGFINETEPFLLVQKISDDIVVVLRKGEEGFDETMALLGYPCGMKVKDIPLVGSPSNLDFLRKLSLEAPEESKK